MTPNSKHLLPFEHPFIRDLIVEFRTGFSAWVLEIHKFKTSASIYPACRTLSISTRLMSRRHVCCVVWGSGTEVKRIHEIRIWKQQQGKWLRTEYEYGFAVLFILLSRHGSSWGGWSFVHVSRVINCSMNMSCLCSYVYPPLPAPSGAQA